MKRIRVLSINDANNGDFLVSWVIRQLFSDYFAGYETKFLEYSPINRQLLEILRTLKPQTGAPLFNFNRYKIISEARKENLPIESTTNEMFINKFLKTQKYEILVVTKPTWDITNQWSLKGFPSAYWLPMDLPSKKVAFGVSAHRSLPNLVTKYENTIHTILNSYSLIGVRDDWTYEIASSSKTHVPIRKIPDPVFSYEFIETNVKHILQEKGIDLARPIVAFAAYGRNELFKELADYFRKHGYQILGLSTFNPNVDINLGDTLTPFQWADVIRSLSFCITDRFHATIMSLLGNIPFVSIEPFYIKDMRNSKIYDLLRSVDLLDCYSDIYKHDFKTDVLIDQIELLQKNWHVSHSKSVITTVRKKKNEIKQFINEMQDILS